jgi:hypothetical protein
MIRGWFKSFRWGRWIVPFWIGTFGTPEGTTYSFGFWALHLARDGWAITSNCFEACE